jgi:hypothetical protein
VPLKNETLPLLDSIRGAMRERARPVTCHRTPSKRRSPPAHPQAGLDNPADARENMRSHLKKRAPGWVTEDGNKFPITFLNWERKGGGDMNTATGLAVIAIVFQLRSPATNISVIKRLVR